MKQRIGVVLHCLALGAASGLWAADPPAKTNDAPAAAAAPPIFVDKALENAVRKFVFEKRDNDKPLVEGDLVNLSTIEAKGLGITNLTGLEKCRELAALDLARNQIVDLGPIKDLRKIQSLTLSDNQIQNLAPLAGITALQYLELSRNRVKDVHPLEGLTNMASLYLSNNQIADAAPVLKLPRLSSLYLDHNQIKSILGVEKLRGLFSLSLNHNQISDLKPMADFPGAYNLYLEENKIRDLTPLVEMVKKDKDQRYAPFLNLYVKGNPLSSAAKGKQSAALKEIGVRLNN